VRCVSVSFSDFDTHSDNFPRLRQLLPIVDHALHALITDLEERGMLQDVSIVAWGEFGRTPRVDAKTGGRHHWPAVGPALLAGGGLEGGEGPRGPRRPAAAGGWGGGRLPGGGGGAGHRPGGAPAGHAPPGRPGPARGTGSTGARRSANGSEPVSARRGAPRRSAAGGRGSPTPGRRSPSRSSWRRGRGWGPPAARAARRGQGPRRRPRAGRASAA